MSDREKASHYFEPATMKLKELLPLIRSASYSNLDELGTHIVLCLECEEWTWVDFNSSNCLLDILGDLEIENIDPCDEKTIRLWVKTDDFNWINREGLV